MGKKQQKSAKKFAKKHLKAAIEKRRKLKPLKNAIRHKEAALEKRRKAAALAENAASTKKRKVQDMDVDELMGADFLDDEIDLDEAVSEDDQSDSELPLPEADEEDFIDITPADQEDNEDSADDGEDNSGIKADNKRLKSEIEKHKKELEKLKQKDPEFYQFLKEHDETLIDFGNDEEVVDDEEKSDEEGSEKKAETVLSSAMVEGWLTAVKGKDSYFALKKLVTAFRSACHYGEGEDDELAESFTITSSQVFNNVMVIALSELDGLFRRMLHISDKKTLTNQDLKKLPRWKKLMPFVRSYLVSSLHVLNQMTDGRMIAFTLRRLKPSIIFLGIFSSLARRYMKTVLHFWGTGDNKLCVVAFLFLRDMALQLGTDCLDTCTKTIYKQFVAHAKFVNASNIAHTQFLANCVVELYGLDMGVSYQNAFSFIRQLAIILRNALTLKSKDAFKKVYCWQYIQSLELWMKVVSRYTGKENLQPLAYPLAQIIDGVAKLLPSARYFPLRMQCAVLLNKLASATNTFVPVASLLLDMLEFKELKKPPTGGAGTSMDFQLVLKVQKPTMKTRAFQEECVLTVLEQLTEHLTQWSFSVAFPELALVPVINLKRFIKETNVDRFRRHAKQLVEQIERNVEFVTKKREGVSFSPKDGEAVAGFLQDEREAGKSPLAQYCNVLRKRALDRKQALAQESVEVKEASKPSNEDNEDEGNAGELFNKKWLAQKKKTGAVLKSKKEEDRMKNEEADANEQDVVEDLMLSSDEEQDEEQDEDVEKGSDEEEIKDNRGNKLNNRKRKNKERNASKRPVKNKKNRRS